MVYLLTMNVFTFPPKQRNKARYFYKLCIVTMAYLSRLRCGLWWMEVTITIFLLFSFKFKYQETFPSALSYLSLPVIFVIIH